MSVSFKAEIRKSQQKRDGTWNIKIRVTKGRDVARIATNFFVDKSQLTRKSFEIIDKKTLDVCNDLINQFRDYLLDLGSEVELFDARHLAKYLSEKLANQHDESRLDLIRFGEKHVEKLNNESRSGYAKNIMSAIHWLKKHYSTLSVTRLTLAEVENMQMKMLETMSQTSANTHLRHIRTLFNACADSLDDDSIIKRYPFRKFKFRPDDKPKEKALDIETLRKIIFFPEHHLKRVNMARDIFTMSFVFLGMNTKDLYCSKQCDGKRITYIREKTKRKGEKAMVAPRIPDEVKDIFNRYRDPDGRRVFNFYKTYSSSENFYKAVDKGLIVICKEVGISQKVTAYWARHSFATIARNDCNIPKDDISICLTHSSGLDITDRYIEKDWSRIDRAQRAVIDLVFNGPRK